ncbi:MAG TPA: hypothetical protein VGD04_10305 [Methylophilus sp.]
MTNTVTIPQAEYEALVKDIVERIKEYTLDGDGYNSEYNLMLLDAIAEITKLREAQDAEKFYDIGFMESGEGFNGEYNCNIESEYYLNKRKLAIDKAMEQT